MRYRYQGSGFMIDAKAGETISDTLKRVVAEQPNVDRPSGQTIRGQVAIVHAIEDMRVAVDFEQARQILVDALEEIARSVHQLVPVE